MIRLRPMTDPEFSAWRDESTAEYAADKARTLGISGDEATRIE